MNERGHHDHNSPDPTGSLFRTLKVCYFQPSNQSVLDMFA